MSRACFDWLVDDLCGELQSAGPLDALYLALHGSMEVRGLDAAPEGVILARVRAIVGPDLPIAVSYDLHVNLAPELVDPAQIVIAYRSNPHWDLFPTGFRAGNRIIRVARQQVQPVHEWRKLAMVTGGGTTISFLPPMRRLFSALKKLERDDPRVLSASLCMVHPFTSAADLGWAVHICTDGDRALAAELADAFADRVWAMRKIDYPPFRSVEEALDEVAESSARRLGPVTLVDADDIVGAGATGGSTAILAGWMRDDRGLGGLFPIHDPAAVAALWPREVGEEVALTIHGTPEYDQPRVDVRGELHAKDEADFGRVVCLRVPSSRLGVNSFIAIAERPPLPISPSFWSALKVEVRRADLMVQKNFFHYRIFYAHLSFKHIGVMAGGATSLTRVQERAYAVPTYPVDDPADWRDQDRLLRAPSRERGRARPEPVA